MDTIEEMYKNLRRCYECSRIDSCFGCPNNGIKLEILQHLKDEMDKNQGEKIDVLKKETAEVINHLLGTTEILADNLNYRNGKEAICSIERAIDLIVKQRDYIEMLNDLIMICKER